MIYYECRERAIRCYVSPAGNNKIAEWYDGLSAQERADTDEFIKDVRKLHEWKMPHYRGLRGLGELRWVSERKQHRLIGFLKKEIWYAVIGCVHKQKIYQPPDALETAERRKKQIENGEVITVAYDF